MRLLFGATAAALAIGLLGVGVAALPTGLCSKGEVEVACESAPVGPSGEAVSDRFFFVHQPLAGDGGLTVRITSMTGRIKEPPPPGTVGPGPEPVPGTVPWAKAGIMIKDGVGQGSSYAAVMVTAGHGVRMQHDFVHDTAGRPDGLSSPRWLRLTRAGDTITGYESVDGHQWTVVAEVRPDLPDQVRIGLFAASPGDVRGNASRFSEVTATFDSVDGGSGEWSQDDIGVSVELDGVTAHHPGGLTESGGRFVVTGVGDVGPATDGLGMKVETLLAGTTVGLLIMIIVAARRGVTAGGGGAVRGGVGVRGGVAVVAGAAGLAGLVGAAAALLLGPVTGAQIRPVPWPVEVRLVIGTGAFLAVATVFAWSVGAILGRRSRTAIDTGTSGGARTGGAGGRRWLAVGLSALLILVPYLIVVAVPGIPAGLGRWLLLLTPAAGFAVQQTGTSYEHVIMPATPLAGLPPWLGLAVSAAFAAVAFAPTRRPSPRSDDVPPGAYRSPDQAAEPWRCGDGPEPVGVLQNRPPIRREAEPPGDDGWLGRAAARSHPTRRGWPR